MYKKLHRKLLKIEQHEPYIKRHLSNVIEMCTYRVSTDCSATSILTVKYDVFTLYVLIIVKAVMHLGWFMASSNAILKSTPLMITHDQAWCKLAKWYQMRYSLC